MGVFEARERQAEMIKSAIKDLAGDGDAEIGHLGEVRQAHPARRMLLAKDDLPIRAVNPPPSPIARPGGRQSSSKTAIGLSPGAAFNIGTASLSQTLAKGSARRRSRRAFFSLGSRESV